MEITDQAILEIGGWQVYKEARVIWKAGAVSLDADCDPSLIKGSVLSAGKPVRAMLIDPLSRDVKGVCPCRDSRRGILCKHVLALGLAFANRGEGSAEMPDPSVSSTRKTCELLIPQKQNNNTELALCLQFADNFLFGLTRGKLALRVVERPGPPTGSDRRIGRWIGEHHSGPLPFVASLGGAQTDAFLRLAAGHPACVRLRKGGREENIEISPMPIRLPVQVKTSSEGGLSRVALGCPIASSLSGAYSMPDTCLFPLAEPPPALSSEWRRLIAGEAVSRPLAWFVSHLDALQGCCDLSEPQGESFLENLHLISEKPEIALTLEGSLQNLTASLRCRYPIAGVSTAPGADLTEEELDAFPAVDPDNPGRFYLRNLPAERAAVNRLENAGFHPQPGRGGDWILSGEKEVLEFYGSVLQRLEGIWKVSLGERFESLTRGLVRITPEAEFSDATASFGGKGGGDWLTLSVRYLGEGGHQIPPHEVQRLLRGGGSGAIRLPGGKKAVLDRSACLDLAEVIQDCNPVASPGVLRVRKPFADYVRRSITSYNRTKGEVGGVGVRSVSEAEFASGVGDLIKRLRGYQCEGAAWLADRLTSAGGALLADEMGLGKTLQTLALLVYWKNRAGSAGSQKPALVVCPKSLLGNWRAEAQRFAPDLKTSVLTGSPEDRAKTKDSGADLFITSYGALIQDIETIYAEREFGVVVLDEAGAIKNPKTRAAKAARSLSAEGKIALTGTPVENSVRDLWSIFEFAIPGYLGSFAQFETRYAKPLENSQQPPTGVMDRLRRRVSPFVLRRTKAEVVRELPQKIETTIFCELTPAQESVYRRILDAAHAEIDAAKKRGAGAAKMAMFTALLRLRQTCCDLRVLPLGGAAAESLTAEEASGKLEAFRAEVDSIVEAGGRMLCFSQFVSVLGLLRDELVRRGVGFSYLDGQTENRAEVVETFQNAPSGLNPVFLISLKAGGYGLNLTAANHVLLYDPWWNPAVEAQAIDRAHRIGQESVVTCSRFIMRGTVEEKILQLQKRKRAVIDAAIEEDQPSMSGLTGSDLEELFG